MKTSLPSRRCFPALLFICLLASRPLAAQEVPLEHCDRLPAIRVEVAGHKSMLFLLDTAASSLLNLQSFVSGDTREVEISSYRGVTNTRAREVNPPEITIGSYHLVGVRMMAIDLSALGAGCGRRIDGILGADLLEKMGATIDFERQVVHFMTAHERRAAELIAEVNGDLERCLAAWRAGDEKKLGECFDSEVTVFAASSSVYRREQALGWLQQHFLPASSKLQAEGEGHVEAHAGNFQLVGEAVWFEYDFDFGPGNDSQRGRGMAMCRKLNGRWRIAGVSPAIPAAERAR
jgi:hypothetical protein